MKTQENPWGFQRKQKIKEREKEVKKWTKYSANTIQCPLSKRNAFARCEFG